MLRNVSVQDQLHAGHLDPEEQLDRKQQSASIVKVTQDQLYESSGPTLGVLIGRVFSDIIK